MKKINSNFAALCGMALMSAVVTLSSCGDAEEVMNPSTAAGYAPVSVHVSDFTISMDDQPGTRAAVDPANYNKVKELTLAFYDGTNEVYKATQVKSDASTYETFGQFSCSLPLGSYTMVVLGRDTDDDDVFTFTSATSASYSSERIRETFCASQNVSVTSTAALSLPVTLTRVVTQLGIRSTDVRPTGVDKIRTTFGAGGKSFNPSTGLATVNTGFVTTKALTSAVGASIAIGSFAFLATDEQTMDITIEVLDGSDNVILTKVVNDVPMKRNRVTNLRGALFSANSTSPITVESSWLTDTTVDF